MSVSFDVWIISFVRWFYKKLYSHSLRRQYRLASISSFSFSAVFVVRSRTLSSETCRIDLSETETTDQPLNFNCTSHYIVCTGILLFNIYLNRLLFKLHNVVEVPHCHELLWRTCSFSFFLQLYRLHVCCFEKIG